MIGRISHFHFYFLLVPSAFCPLSLLFVCLISDESALYFIFYFGLSAKPLFKVVALEIARYVLITVYYLKVLCYYNVATVQQFFCFSLHPHATVLGFTVMYVCSPQYIATLYFKNSTISSK